ncbi:MAG TPA: dTDP-4-dehydrorhamnose 3,5-epimerase [Candidatus Binataceae bacterium]|nr:dTDP-4-dehydrorhamnose 3,5-epimerase [Candidatus Binataceae bacterium]
MRFIETPLKGAFVVELEPRSDERGFFARAFCREEFLAHGLNPAVMQCNVSFNPVRGTLRGMHYQIAPAQESKLVRCTRGAIFDAMVDLRPESPTYLRWFGIELTAVGHTMIYVPEGFAHGYLSLVDDTEVFYQVSEFYRPDHERGARWNDPSFGIKWPFEPIVISNKDRSHPDFQR